jgi:hypothetical protein
MSVKHADRRRRAFEGWLGSINALTEMIGRIRRLLPDPTALGSFLE